MSVVVVDVNRPAAAAAAAVGQPKPESSSSSKRTADFWRACRYLGPHRKIVIISIICAFLVGARFTAGRSEFFEGFRIVQESLSTFHCG